jgi:DNA-binding GntR family transcriptional regulator
MCALLDRADELVGQFDAVSAGGPGERELVVELLDCMRRFHAAIDQASGNSTLIQMLHMVDAFGADERRDSLLGEVNSERRSAVRERYRQHRAIYDAIAAGDGYRAEELMRVHSRDSNTSRLAARFSG